MGDNSRSSRIDPDTGCRLPPVDPETLPTEARAALARQLDPARGSLVGLRGPFGIRLHSPVIAQHGQGLIDYYRTRSVLDRRTQEVAILITARMHDSSFEWAAHEPAAVKAGVPRTTIEAIRHGTPIAAGNVAPEEGTRDDLVVQIGRQLFQERKLDEALYGRAIEAFGTQGLVELVSLMAMYAGTASLLAAFDMQLPDGITVDLPIREA